MATSTQQRSLLRLLRQRLDDIRAAAGSTCDLFVRAMESFLSAAHYPDPVLMKSYLEEATSTWGGWVAEWVEQQLERSSAAKKAIQEISALFEGDVIEPDEQHDDLGRSLSLAISSNLNALCKLRDEDVAILHRRGFEVPNAAKLDEHIAHWEAVKANLVDCWPWTDSPLPPVDREMVAASRAAFQAGNHGEDIDALIERLRSE